MKKVKIVRTESGDTGVFGNLSTGTLELYSLERPETGDHPCIPAGTYSVGWRSKAEHPKKGPCYEVLNVKDRSAILIHPANIYLELLGCIAFGRSIQDIELKDHPLIKGITSSKDAVSAFENDMDRLPFELTVSWTPGVSKA